MGKTKYHICRLITTLGFVSRNIKDFAKFVKPLGISYERMIGKCMETALRASFYIFTRRDKEWPNAELPIFTSCKWEQWCANKFPLPL